MNNQLAWVIWGIVAVLLTILSLTSLDSMGRYSKSDYVIFGITAVWLGPKLLEAFCRVLAS